jgi:hypothetical protein
MTLAGIGDPAGFFNPGSNSLDKKMLHAATGLVAFRIAEEGPSEWANSPSAIGEMTQVPVATELRPGNGPKMEFRRDIPVATYSISLTDRHL